MGAAAGRGASLPPQPVARAAITHRAAQRTRIPFLLMRTSTRIVPALVLFALAEAMR
jgi:hypothetical protein